jgi:hypothetical protein
MATAIVWGLLFAGPLTLVVTPCMLALPHVMKERGLFKWLGRYLNPRRLRKDATPAPVPAE